MISTTTKHALRIPKSLLKPRFLHSNSPLLAPPASLSLKNESLWKDTGYLNGKWESGTGSETGDRFDVYNPANSEIIGTLPEMGLQATKLAIDHAATAFKTWSQTTEYQRSVLLRKFYDLMVDNQEDLAKILTAENGKTLADAKGEVAYGASFLDWYSGEAVRNYGDIIPSSIPGVQNFVIKQPVGVCGIITPWNFPNAMVTRKLGAALAAGCTAIIKAPHETPYSVLAIAALAEQAGIPKGVVNVVLTTREVSAVGKELCESDLVSKVSFTGSTRVGKILMSQSSSTLKKLSMELGGNGPLIVFDDADIDKAVAGTVVAKFRLSGQTCVCANRIFVHSSVFAEYSSKLVAAVSAFRTGNGTDPTSTHGPLIHKAAVDKVDRHVRSAVENGGEVLLGGKRPEGLEGGSFFEPTVVSMPQGARSEIDEEETFGPIAALYQFESEEEVIKRANEADVGLAGYIFTESASRIARVSAALRVGMVGANTGGISQAGIPFGGVKQSGFGREGSKYGLAEYQSIKLVSVGGV